ncbi:MAG TPA: transketolase C-terminal domain-containing protein [Anaerolineaceae bacterium]|jgi:pyruvate/2-oxoglutarate/acetoin dehydrogenase E1 component|nr:transketolase C-terminal domain-containing protein [Anaerolineaceae bacterium]
MNTSVLSSLNAGLLRAMQKDEHVYLLGEDILDPYGGAFKVTKGCSSAFPERVLAAPISEAGLAGVSAGMALRGLRPVLEIMFGDFITLTADQLVNHISKFHWMYDHSVRLPMVIRAPMGGRRGYGPTHSQTLEKLFIGIPGLTLIAPLNLTGENDAQQPGGLLEDVILRTEEPVLFIENKLQYLLPVYQPQDLPELDWLVEQPVKNASMNTPTYLVRVSGAPAARVSLTAYGYMAELARQAMLKLAYEDEIFVELVIPTRLAPFDITALADSIKRTGRLVTVEEGNLTGGWGAEVMARALEEVGGRLRAAVRVAARDLPVAAAPSLENEILPDVEDIVQAVRKVVGRNE